MRPKRLLSLLALSVFAFNPLVLLAQTGVKIIDAHHYSNTFSETRNYRVFLPPGYYDNPGKKYPVIYFLHGWSQRSFGSSVSRYAEFDRGDENGGDNMEKFVSTHEVIVVKSDGYNRSAGEEYYLRPYNIGPVETFRQFPIYFPELINHIDATYKTKATRENRAITGLSMGGFMSFVIGGKYPHLFSAVGNFCGSPEFVIGPKEMPVEYRHLDMYNNYGGMKVRLNYGDNDFIRAYHEDINRVWTRVMNNYEYKIYPTEHTTSGLGEMFSFLFNSFSNPSAKPQQWGHTDIYPEFSVWDYSVITDRIVPGFTKLENVNQRGFKCAVRTFLPDGELMPFVNVTVITAPLYQKNMLYVVNDIDINNSRVSQKTIKSDNSGRLKINLNGGLHQIGINKQQDKPNIAIAGFAVTNSDWVVPGKEMTVTVNLVNKGIANGSLVMAKLYPISKDVQMIKGESSFGTVAVNKIKTATPFSFKVVSDTAEVIQFKLIVRDGNKNEWSELFEVPVLRESPAIKEFEIGDGKKFAVWKGGVDSETVKIGYGNGDGIANPGESIEILIKDGDKYRRTLLYAADSCAKPFDVNARGSDYWGIYDNVGGSAKYSIPLLSSACSVNHTVNFFAEYWLPDKPYHIIKRGKLAINVSGKDETPPVVSWVKVAGDNILLAKIIDGSAVQSVTATIIPEKNPRFTVVLKDDGKKSDAMAGDIVFSALIPQQDFGFYKVIIEAVDSFGNKTVQEMPDTIMLH